MENNILVGRLFIGYMRDYATRSAKHVKDHTTGRKCDNTNCGGDLKDTIINFGENLREIDIKTGFDHGAAADVQLANGRISAIVISKK